MGVNVQLLLHANATLIELVMLWYLDRYHSELLAPCSVDSWHLEIFIQYLLDETKFGRTSFVCLFVCCHGLIMLYLLFPPFMFRILEPM